MRIHNFLHRWCQQCSEFKHMGSGFLYNVCGQISLRLCCFMVFNVQVGPGYIFQPCTSFLIFMQSFSCYYPWTRSVLRYTSQQVTLYKWSNRLGAFLLENGNSQLLKLRDCLKNQTLDKVSNKRTCQLTSIVLCSLFWIS